jgi:hypothetical protein
LGRSINVKLKVFICQNFGLIQPSHSPKFKRHGLPADKEDFHQNLISFKSHDFAKLQN